LTKKVVESAPNLFRSWKAYPIPFGPFAFFTTFLSNIYLIKSKGAGVAKYVISLIALFDKKIIFQWRSYTP
jgi:hypothetical protein